MQKSKPASFLQLGLLRQFSFQPLLRHRNTWHGKHSQETERGSTSLLSKLAYSRVLIRNIFPKDVLLQIHDSGKHWPCGSKSALTPVNRIEAWEVLTSCCNTTRNSWKGQSRLFFYVFRSCVKSTQVCCNSNDWCHTQKEKAVFKMSGHFSWNILHSNHLQGLVNSSHFLIHVSITKK